MDTDVSVGLLIRISGRGATATTRGKVTSMQINNGQFENGLRVFRAGLVERTGDFSFQVKSETGNSQIYTVNNEGCTCPDSQHRQRVCKHMVACGILFACSMWIPLTDKGADEPPRNTKSFSVELPAVNGLTIRIDRDRATLSFS